MSECVDCVKGHCDRWDHLVEVTLKSIAARMDKCIRDLDSLKPAKMTMGDEVPRCACGGMFQPATVGGGVMVCDCCGATWDFGGGQASKAGSPPDEEVGRTLTEVLLVRRRHARVGDWKPSDDDVKVTVHG